jgi:hypothetical protein
VPRSQQPGDSRSGFREVVGDGYDEAFGSGGLDRRGEPGAGVIGIAAAGLLDGTQA